MKKSIGKKKREKQRQEIIIQKLREIAVFTNGWYDGGWFPCLKPKHHTDFMEFDKSVCELGLKKFVRQEMDGEFSYLANDDSEKFCVLVSEVVPGVRTRMPIYGEEHEDK